ncbi:g3304 [Coccomyxa elongata]
MPSLVALQSGPAPALKADVAHARGHVVTKAAAASIAAPSVPQRAAQPLKVQTTTGAVRYAKQPADGQERRIYVYDLPEGVDKASNLDWEQHDVTVTDLRTAPQTFTLHENGFQLERFEVPQDIDWQNEQEVKEKVYPLLDALLKRVTGATRTHIFDHTLRNGRINLEPAGKPTGRGQPVPMVHVDYTTKSGFERLDALLPQEEADRLKKTPFAAVQVWRPLKGPVDDSPLVMIDASTVDKEDLMQYAIHFPGRTGYNYAVKHNPKHKFYYAKGMNVDEAYVFVCYDSRTDRARFTPHTGIKDYNTSPNAPPRESVELRSYCFFEDLPPQQPAMQL